MLRLAKELKFARTPGAVGRLGLVVPGGQQGLSNGGDEEGVQVFAAREAAVGLALILLLRFRPSGILPETRNIAPRMGDQKP